MNNPLKDLTTTLQDTIKGVGCDWAYLYNLVDESIEFVNDEVPDFTYEQKEKLRNKAFDILKRYKNTEDEDLARDYIKQLDKQVVLLLWTRLNSCIENEN
jgi:hypothetical protein